MGNRALCSTRVCGQDATLYPDIAQAAAGMAAQQPPGTHIGLYVMSGGLDGQVARWLLYDAVWAAPRHSITIYSATDCVPYAGVVLAESKT